MARTRLLSLLLAGLVFARPVAAYAKPPSSRGHETKLRTQMIAAAAAGDAAKVEALITAGADPDARDRRGSTALMIATRVGALEVIRVLLADGANAGARAPDGTTALEVAVQNDRGNAIRLLAPYCAPPDCVLDAFLMTALQGAKPSAATALIDSGASPNSRDARGDTALAVASARGNLLAVKALLARGADASVRLPSGELALHRAAMYGRGAVIDVLIAAGTDVDVRISSRERRDGWTPLMVAAAEAKPEAAEHLIGAGAYVDARDHHGRTALVLAAWYGSAAVVNVLLAASADPDAPDVVDLTPARAAALAGNPEVLGAFKRRHALR